MTEVSLVNGHIDEPKRETNYERIMKMNVEELATFMNAGMDNLCYETCVKEKGNRFSCKHGEGVKAEDCINCAKRWLESEDKE